MAMGTDHYNKIIHTYTFFFLFIVSKALGWQLCSEVSIPGEETRGFIFPGLGPVKATITLKKQDRRLHQYLMKAAYNYVSQVQFLLFNQPGCSSLSSLVTPIAEIIAVKFWIGRIDHFRLQIVSLLSIPLVPGWEQKVGSWMAVVAGKMRVAKLSNLLPDASTSSPGSLPIKPPWTIAIWPVWWSVSSLKIHNRVFSKVWHSLLL